MLLHEFLPLLEERFGAGPVALVGRSMGGFGALAQVEFPGAQLAAARVPAE